MKMYRLAASIALVLTLAGCGGGGGSLTQAGSITGRAVDAQGQPLRAATVSLVPAGRSHLDATHSTTTDIEGRFSMTNVEAGTYTLAIIASGPGGMELDVQVSVTVPAGSNIDLMVRVSQTGGGIIPDDGFGVITGTALDEFGHPAVGVRIKAENERTGQELVTASDANGRFVFDDVRPGLWKVWADPEGPDRSDRVWVEVDEGHEVQTTLRIEDRDNSGSDDDDDDDD